MADATSFLLPTEPFEVLIQSLDALDLKPHDEKWATPSEAIRYLKSFFCPPPPARELRSERCWHEEDVTYERLSELCRPMSPILTNRARRETPKLGSSMARESIPRTEPTLIAFLGLRSLSIKSVEDLPGPATDDVLDLHFALDSSTRAEVRQFLQSVLAPPTGQRSRDRFDHTPNVDTFLWSGSPPRCRPRLESPPLFPRSTRPGHAGVKNNPKSRTMEENNVDHISTIVSMLKHAPPEIIESEDGDINGQHMEVVNGWTTLTLSSPSPPSLHSSASSEVDEIWDISSPGTPATSLLAARMEEVEIPRLRKFGYKNRFNRDGTAVGGTTDLLTATKSPGSFITSFISAPVPVTQAPKRSTSQLEVARLYTHSPRPLSSPNQSTSNSLLGQPPSACEDQVEKVSAGTELPDCVEDWGPGGLCLDAAVASIYASTPHDALSCILEEKLDHKEIILMEVPDLPPPTTHAKEPTFFPEGMQSFVTPKEPVPGVGETVSRKRGAGPAAFLRLAKGIKPLALDLSWRPFNFGKSIPTDEEVAGVGQPFRVEDDIPGYRDERQVNDARELFDLSTSPIIPENVQDGTISMGLRRCEGFGTSPTPGRDENTQFEYVLTRREMIRALGTPRTLAEEAEARVDESSEQGVELNLQDHEIEGASGQNESLHQRENHLAHTLIDTWDHMAYRTNRGTFVDDLTVDTVDQGRGDLSIGYQELGESGTPADKENIDERSENKENIPPWDSTDRAQLAYHHPNHFRAQHELLHDLDIVAVTNFQDKNEYLKHLESVTSPFEPLSFVSQNQALGSPNASQHLRGMWDIPVGPSQRMDGFDNAGKNSPDLLSTSRAESTRTVKRRKLDDIVQPSSRDLFSTFVGLRNQVPGPPPPTSPMPQVPAVPEKSPLQVTPDDLFDQHTVRLPEPWVPPTTTHRHLASMAFIQKRALVRNLQDDGCRIVLVERCNLGGTDIIIDPDHGVLFKPLLALPAQLESAVDSISRASWRYSNILIVFEAYPSAQSYKTEASQNMRLIPYAYSPPVCKAIKKLRRTLGIAEGCGTMNSRCRVTWAFANHPEESARIVRCFGEEARATAIDKGNDILWDEREWLEEEEREGESDLSGVQGMNAFAALVMLYDRPLQTILDSSSEARLGIFGQLLGQERLIGLNAVIEERMSQLSLRAPLSTSDTEGESFMDVVARCISAKSIKVFLVSLTSTGSLRSSVEVPPTTDRPIHIPNTAHK
ncbi:hypothetical protein BU15DRAFT_58684 [Melanogaster broomeanus]|nr:hypothetical protein BU15DRAFT_58684 [Melanogaster broomeanus]